MNIIGKIEDVDDVVRDLLETKKVSPTSAIAEIEKNNFLLDVNDENVDRLVDLNFVHFYKKKELQLQFHQGDESQSTQWFVQR